MEKLTKENHTLLEIKEKSFYDPTLIPLSEIFMLKYTAITLYTSTIKKFLNLKELFSQK